MIGIAEQRDPAQLVAIARPAPVDRVATDVERAAFVRERQPDDERADQLRRTRRVLVTREVSADRIDDHVGELGGELRPWRQRRFDLG